MDVSVWKVGLAAEAGSDAETTGGGFPGWVGNIGGSLRTNNPNYTESEPLCVRATPTHLLKCFLFAAWVPYMTAITKIIARNQITEGGPGASLVDFHMK